MAIERTGELEHAAWLHVMDRLRELGVEPNHATSDPLIGAMRQWGEMYANLRAEEPADR